MTNVISENVFAYERGMKMFRDGEKCPPNSPWKKLTAIQKCHWMGWMMARADVVIKEIRTQDWAENGGDLPPSAA